MGIQLNDILQHPPPEPRRSYSTMYSTFTNKRPSDGDPVLSKSGQNRRPFSRRSTSTEYDASSSSSPHSLLLSSTLQIGVSTGLELLGVIHT